MKKHHIENYISAEKIQQRIAEIGKALTEDYKGKAVKLIIILKGAAPFACDLMKCIDNDKLTIDFMAVSSYDHGTESSGIVRIIKDLDKTIEGENIVVIEDIVDSGNTLHNLINLLKTRKPASIKVCTLLDKPSRRQAEVHTDYVGFEIEDKFVAGYGLDYDQLYRQLPYIGIVVFDE